MTNDDGLGEAMLRDSAAQAHEKPLAELRQRIEDLTALVLTQEKRIRLLTEHADLTNNRLDQMETTKRAEFGHPFVKN